MPSPLPPWASGSDSPSQPSWAISFQMASLSPRGSSHEARTVAGLQCSSRNPRAEFFRSCWSDVNPKSMDYAFTRSARISLGRPSTRSPITFFWISDEPE